MSFLKSLFGKDKEELISNNKEVYRKFLVNYGQNPTHEYLKQLTLEAGENYYAILRKDGKLTAEDEEAIRKDMEKAIQENERVKTEPVEESELRKLYQDYMKKQ